MRVNTLILQNFCCFENRQFHLAERFNLLIGDNGSGKTSILDGLAVALSALFPGLPESPFLRDIHLEEVRFRSFLQGDSYTRERQYPVVVSCQCTVNGQPGGWTRTLDSIGRNLTERITEGSIQDITAILERQVRGGIGDPTRRFLLRDGTALAQEKPESD